MAAKASSVGNCRPSGYSRSSPGKLVSNRRSCLPRPGHSAADPLSVRSTLERQLIGGGMTGAGDCIQWVVLGMRLQSVRRGGDAGCAISISISSTAASTPICRSCESGRSLPQLTLRCDGGRSIFREILVEQNNTAFMKNEVKMNYFWHDVERRAARHKDPIRRAGTYPADPDLLALRVGIIAAQDGWWRRLLAGDISSMVHRPACAGCGGSRRAYPCLPWQITGADHRPREERRRRAPAKRGDG